MRFKLPLWYIITLIIAIVFLFGSTLWLDMRNMFSGSDLSLVFVTIGSTLYLVVSLSVTIVMNIKSSSKNRGKHLELFMNENKDFFDEMNLFLMLFSKGSE